MSPEEADWFARALAQFGQRDLAPLINIGSSTAKYRTTSTVAERLFEPLARRGVKVLHLDQKGDPGVDIVGDILDPAVFETARQARPQSILCNNVLEHVADRDAFIRQCLNLLPPAGLLFLSVPRHYPYHPDPIDTGYRPDLPQLQEAVQPCELVRGEIVPFGNYWGQLRAKKWLILRDLYLLPAGFLQRDRWKVLIQNYRYLFSNFEVCCAIFRKSEQRHRAPAKVIG
ncbi:MAG: hypothetical protein OER90_08010 [Gemmatimonadota bacterium]|nr:hypothetical protein [Gemmatimonadota bacterium]